MATTIAESSQMLGRRWNARARFRSLDSFDFPIWRKAQKINSEFDTSSRRAFQFQICQHCTGIAGQMRMISENPQENPVGSSDSKDTMQEKSTWRC